LNKKVKIATNMKPVEYTI